MIEQILIDNGLSEKETKLYLAALQCGEATVAAVAQHAGIERTTVYNLLDDLRKKGLLSFTKRRGIQYVSALPPRVLVDRFQKSAALAESVLPQLLEMAYSSPLRPRMRFYENMSGLKDILREVGHSTHHTAGFTDYAAMPKELAEFIRKEVAPERRRHGNFIRLLAPDNAANAAMRAQNERHYGEHRLLRFPKDAEHVEILLFDQTKTAFLSFAPGELFGTVIDSAAIHRMLLHLFGMLWENAPAQSDR
jgi:sugar-specific transcriptional regulator TrmB